MSRIQKPFTLFKRQNGFYYCQFRLPDGSRSLAKSTGEKARARAEVWAINYLQAGSGVIVKREKVKFKDIAEGFYNWDSPFVLDKRATGGRISPRHCRECSDYLKNHILPVLGERYLSSIDKDVLSTFRNNCFQSGYSASTINKLLGIIKNILERAENQGLIMYVPKVQRASGDAKRKGVLSIEQARRLLCPEIWPDKKYYTANLLAAVTGIRLGELQALTLEDCHLDDGYIIVRRSWDKRLHVFNKTTKTRQARNIIIPENVIRKLKCYIDGLKDTRPDAFLFPADEAEHYPINEKMIRKTLYAALGRIGIAEPEREKLNITFHSWRYLLNSILINAKIPLFKVQSITGHLTQQMSEHYYKSGDDMADVISVTSGLLN